jgi:hypothetical protein
MTKKKTAPAAALKGWAAIAKFMGTTPASNNNYLGDGLAAGAGVSAAPFLAFLLDFLLPCL